MKLTIGLKLASSLKSVNPRNFLSHGQLSDLVEFWSLSDRCWGRPNHGDLYALSYVIYVINLHLHICLVAGWPRKGRPAWSPISIFIKIFLLKTFLSKVLKTSRATPGNLCSFSFIEPARQLKRKLNDIPGNVT